MKGLTRLQSFVVMTALAFTASPRADLFIFSTQFRYQYNEHPATLIGASRKDVDTETIDASTVGPDGDFYVAGNSLGSGTIYRLDGITGAFKSVFVPVRDGVAVPHELEFGPDGDLYVSGGIWSDSADRVVIKRYDGKTGEPKGYFIDESANVTAGGAFAFGPDGNAYVLNKRGEMLRFDAATGQFIDLFCSLSNAELGTFKFGPDDNIYALAWNNHVYRINGKTGESVDLLDGVAAGMQGPRKIIIGPDGDIYLADMAEGQTIWRFDRRTGASKGIFIKNEPAAWYDGWISTMIFSGPRISISHGKNGPCLKWPNTFGNFELQSRAGLDVPWQTVADSPTTLGCTLSLELTSSSDNLIFRLIKR